MSLKDRLAESIGETIYDIADGFAEPVNYNGQPIIAVLTPSERVPGDTQGTFIRKCQLMIKGDDPAPPVPDEQVQVDGQYWWVLNVETIKDLTIIDLYRAA